MAVACSCGQPISSSMLLRSYTSPKAWGHVQPYTRQPSCRPSAATAHRHRLQAAAAAAQDTQPASSAPIKRRSVSLVDAFKFNGPAPELINGRLAMLGFLYVVRGEIDTSQTALQLLQHGTPWQYGLMALWVAASLIPITKGVRHEAFGVFSPRAEITNGRAAMLGWAILLALEYKAGVPFF